MKTLVIIGGGASGFFLGANIKSENWKVIILEQAKHPLQKVKISGGGRCNVTNACFNPKELVKSYPRGSKELLSVFSCFQPADTLEWFAQRNIRLKTEDDNRVFPETDSSQTIIDALLHAARENGVQIHYETPVTGILKDSEKFEIKTTHRTYQTDALVVAAGSSSKIWEIISGLGHTIVPPVPSLFTFNCKNDILTDLQGISFPKAELLIPQFKLKESGSLLITHWGLSGPAILKLSSRGAREAAFSDYNFTLRINWVSEKFDHVKENLSQHRSAHPKKSIYSLKLYDIPQRFWKNMLQTLEIKEKTLSDLGKTESNKIAETLTNSQLQITGKSTFKEEFVTAGGVDLKEIDFRTMQSKLIPDLYFAGEVLNIDALTGGFNLQACWSEAFVISRQFK
ncbi:MAG: NAD(P)/FAD-dependent oxidoreductase [Flavobacteriaceae bacterium]|jgi:predicted Rossmann fold flavoprotein|nr:NAD(P)/FAD-dependent oxidoreductase [Flavobacteriaceae bacterium]